MTEWKQLVVPGVVMLLLISLAPAGATATTAYVKLVNCALESGGTVTVPVRITNATGLGGCDINVTYDASVVHVTNVISGNMELLTYMINNESGWVRMNAINITGQSGDAVPANLKLTAIGDAGSVSTLCVADVTLIDTGYEIVPHVTGDGTCTIFLNGDADSDRRVDMHDAIYLMQHLLGVTGFEAIVPEAADVNGDGEVTSHDAMYLAKHLIGISGYEKLK